MRIAAAFVMGLLAVGLAQPAVADTDEDIPTWEYAEDDYAATAQIEPSEQDEYFRHDLPIRLSVRCSGSNLHARLSLTNPTLAWAKRGGTYTLHSVLSTNAHGRTVLAWAKPLGASVLVADLANYGQFQMIELVTVLLEEPSFSIRVMSQKFEETPVLVFGGDSEQAGIHPLEKVLNACGIEYAAPGWVRTSRAPFVR